MGWRKTDTSAPPLDRKSLELRPRRIRQDDRHCFAYSVPRGFLPAAELPAGDVAGRVLEDGRPLGPGGSKHDVIRERGAGRFSLWRDPDRPAMTLYFSASDNSSPRANGRRYTLVTQPEGWGLEDRRDAELEAAACSRWLRHPKGQYFLDQGGDRVPPPLFANLGITDLCNLQCSICGSQNMLGPVKRRFMEFQRFSEVADTLFPLIDFVEFNSRGEPTLHPRFADMLRIVGDHDLHFRLQTNGTRFSSEILEVLRPMKGEISVSVDATGALFEYARRHAEWSEVDAGVRRLLEGRDRDRLAVCIYPTLTAKTIQGSRDLISWAVDVGIDRIDFHSYDPIEGCAEEAPAAADLAELERDAAAVEERHPVRINVNYQTLKPGSLPRALRIDSYSNIPRAASDSGAHPEYVCAAPVQSVDLDLDGGVCVCCRLQERALGSALTVEAFADCWLGGEYRAVRESLARAGPGPSDETCRSCVEQFAG